MCDNIPAVYISKLVKARKNHQCCECQKAIAPGDHYLKAKGLWEGEWSMFATCASCQKLWDYLEWMGWECPSHGELRDVIFSQGLVADSNPHGRGRACAISTEVDWLRIGVGGRFELVENMKGDQTFQTDALR